MDNNAIHYTHLLFQKFDAEERCQMRKKAAEQQSLISRIKNKIVDFGANLPIIRDLKSDDPAVAAEAARKLFTIAGAFTGGIAGLGVTNAAVDNPDMLDRAGGMAAGASVVGLLANYLAKNAPQRRSDTPVSDAVKDSIAYGTAFGVPAGAASIGLAANRQRHMASRGKIKSIVQDAASSDASAKDSQKLIAYLKKQYKPGKPSSVVAVKPNKPGGAVDVNKLLKDLPIYERQAVFDKAQELLNSTGANTLTQQQALSRALLIKLRQLRRSNAAMSPAMRVFNRVGRGLRRLI